jgi:NADH-quinone oxidoreductase subunit I
MIAGLRGLLITIRWLFRKPVTAHYPKQHLPIQDRFMGFPALLWDDSNDEPFCTGCMVCVRECPTQCMTAEMKDNPLQAEGKSHRRKIIDVFEINLNRCILCGICVDVCAFDAIEMSHEHELSSYARNGARADLPALLKLGRQYQTETGWEATNPEKNVATAVLSKKAAAAQARASAAESADTQADAPDTQGEA